MIGGLNSIILEKISERNIDALVIKKTLPANFLKSGDYKDLMKYYQLDELNLVDWVSGHLRKDQFSLWKVVWQRKFEVNHL